MQRELFRLDCSREGLPSSLRFHTHVLAAAAGAGLALALPALYRRLRSAARASTRRGTATAASFTVSTACDVDTAVRGACARGLLTPASTLDDHPLGFFYDLDAYEACLASLRSAFPSHWLHATAVKTNPLAGLLRLSLAAGHGAECASMGEVQHCMRLGFKGSAIVYDSPCKTRAELRFALEQGLHLNIDNMLELERVRQLVEELGGTEGASRGVIGLRINPLVGAGKVASLSVSTRRSKFGVVLPPEDGPEREAVVEALCEASFIDALHVHTGSGGMTLAQMAEGAGAATRLAAEVNARRRQRRAGAAPSISVIDIGGGLPVVWGSERQIGFDEYAAALREAAPALFDGSSFRRVVTEFGAVLNCQHAWCGAVVETTKPTDGGGMIAMIHAGSDLFMRQCYAPGMRAPHPVTAYEPGGTPKQGPSLAHDVAGPLCFGGDVVCPAVELPGPLSAGDIVVLHEAGGNCLSMATSHCSRRRPPVYGYRAVGTADTDPSGVRDGLCFTQLSSGTTLDQVLAVWAD